MKLMSKLAKFMSYSGVGLGMCFIADQTYHKNWDFIGGVATLGLFLFARVLFWGNQAVMKQAIKSKKSSIKWDNRFVSCDGPRGY